MGLSNQFEPSIVFNRTEAIVWDLLKQIITNCLLIKQAIIEIFFISFFMQLRNRKRKLRNMSHCQLIYFINFTGESSPLKCNWNCMAVLSEKLTSIYPRKVLLLEKFHVIVIIMNGIRRQQLQILADYLDCSCQWTPTAIKINQQTSHCKGHLDFVSHISFCYS